MSEAELDAELRSYGIDPEQMIQNTFQKVCVALKAQSNILAAANAEIAKLREALEAMVSDVNRSDYHTRRTAFEKARAALEGKP